MDRLADSRWAARGANAPEGHKRQRVVGAHGPKSDTTLGDEVIEWRSVFDVIHLIEVDERAWSHIRA